MSACSRFASRTIESSSDAQLHGVDRMYYLEPGGPISNAQPNIVYLCSASPKLMRVIAGASAHWSDCTPDTFSPALCVPTRAVVSLRPKMDSFAHEKR